MSTSRTDFNNTWLFEMPLRIGNINLYDLLVHNIKERMNNGSPVVDIKDGFRKIDGKQTAYYWYEENGVVSLVAELSVKPQGLIVNGIAKNPTHDGPPYASTLYNEILNDSQKSIRLFSDAMITDEGFAIWVRLFQLGNKISVYNRSEPGNSFTTIKNIEDMKKYFGSPESGRYQFVLSRPGEMFAEAQSMFNTRRMRELSGMPLND